MPSPLVSIIIPCYNSEKTIKRTLTSIGQQTYQPIELIAVNDGSTDQTQAILETNQDKLTLVTQENRGASAARNTGFKKSKGAYIFFCDADVTMKPDMIQKMVTALESHPDKAYCYCNFRFGYHTFDLFPFDAERLKKENYISTMSVIRRQCFIGFDESLRRYQDWDLWKRMLQHGYEGIWYPERLFSAPLSRKGISAFSFKELLSTIRRKLSL